MGTLKDFLNSGRTVNFKNLALAGSVLTPSWFFSLLAPWFEPFKKLGLIHPLWLPEIDIAASAIAAVVAPLGYMYLRGCRSLILRRVALCAAAIFLMSFAACAIMRSEIRHVGEQSWIDAFHYLWGALYILSFSALAIFVLAFLVWVILTEGVPKGADNEPAGTMDTGNGQPPE